MKKILIIILIIAVILVIYRKNSSIDSVILNVTKKDISETAQLKYRIYLFGLLPIGEAVFYSAKQIKYQDKDVYYLEAKASTLNIISKIVMVSCVLSSYIDKTSALPVFFKQQINISGKKDLLREVFYDQELGVMILSGVKRQIPSGTQDPISAMFNIRRMDLIKTEDIDININTNQKNYALRGEVLKKDLVIKGKIYKIAMINSEIKRRDKNNPYHKSKVTMVLLTGRQNLPLLIRVFASGFLINIKLVDVQ